MNQTTSHKPLWIGIILSLCLVLAACGGQAPKGTSAPTAAPTDAGQAYPAQPTVAEPSGGYPAPNQTNPTQAGYPAPSGGQESTPTAGGARVTIVKPDGSQADLGAGELSSAPLSQVSSGSQVENGYKVADVLKAAGVEQYQQITVTAASGSLTYTPADLPADAILAFGGANGVTLASGSLTPDKWLTGVTRIEVK